jgi:hypothetical protein
MMAKKRNSDVELLKTWTLSPMATLGSSVRIKGILLEIRARLPTATKKSLDLDGGDLVLAMPTDMKAEFEAVSAIVREVLASIETLPVIPREIQDILSIKASERHRWLADGRLPSAGTRTVRLNGRARRITFHVFDPRMVEDLLNRGAVDEWREEDAATKAENRQRAAYRAKLTRASKRKGNHPVSGGAPDDLSMDLVGWEDFGRDGLLR